MTLLDRMKIATDYVHSKRPEKKDVHRYDVHQSGKNIAHAIVHKKSTEGDGPWISGVYVSPDHRGKGLAKDLMKAVERDHAGQTLRLRAKPYSKGSGTHGLDKDTLVGAYKRWGFKSYDPKEPTRMKKDISSPKTAGLIDRVKNSVDEITKQAGEPSEADPKKTDDKVTADDKLWKQRPALIGKATAGRRRLMDPGTENNSRKLYKALL